MKLLLKDKTEIDLAAGSTPEDMVCVVKTLGALDAIRAAITEEALEGAKLGEGELRDLIPVSIAVTASPGDENITAHLLCRFKSEAERQRERIAELEEENRARLEKAKTLEDAIVELAEVIYA